MTGHLIVTDEDAIRVITLRRPGKKNAITQDMYRGMSEAIDGAQSNPAIRCIIITGGLGAFTAGNDLEDFLKDGTSNTDAPRASEATRFLYSLAHNAKPIIAAVDGVAIGIGGFGRRTCFLPVTTNGLRIELAEQAPLQVETSV